MSSPPDRRAVGWLLALGVAGAAVRFFAQSPGPPGAIAYQGPAAPSGAMDSVAARARRLAAPLRKGERIDLDRASVEDITRLPRIGPGLAARIVADREANGPFGSLAGLDRVPGIGPSVLGAVKPYVTFSLQPRPAYPPIRPPAPAIRPPALLIRPSAARVSLSTASPEVLSQIPGIGPARASAIVAYRRKHGPFRSVAGLDSVPGFGSVLVRRVTPFVVP